MVDDKIREFAKGIAGEMLSSEIVKYSLLFMDMLAKEKGIGKDTKPSWRAVSSIEIYWNEIGRNEIPNDFTLENKV